LDEKLTFEDINALSDSDLDLLFGGTQMPGPDHRFDELHRLMPDKEKRFRKKGMTIAQLWKDYKDLYKHGYQLTQFYRYIGKIVKLQFSRDRVDTFYKYERISSYPRQYRKYNYTTTDDHLASSHRYLSDWTPDKFIDLGKEIDEEVAAFIQVVIEHKSHPEQAYK